MSGLSETPASQTTLLGPKNCKLSRHFYPGRRRALSIMEVRLSQRLLGYTHRSLRVAPDLPTRRLVLSARPPKPTPDLSDSTNKDMSWSTQQNPPRPAYPKEMLKGRFLPAGSLAPIPAQTDAMDVDEPAKKPISTAQEDSGSKSKKRKMEGGSKKSKKAKSTE